MSKAGIQSNRGDGYQTLVAFEWALTVVSDPNYQWIEIDSITHGVDDVVIGRSDGSIICCQCKKNQPAHQSWSIADLADELRKAHVVLSGDPRATVRFYSRSPFGEMASLKEFSTNYPDDSSYNAGLGKTLRIADEKLKVHFNGLSTSLSTFEFLQRTSFDVSPQLDRMSGLLLDRLRQLASNPAVAYDAIWSRLDHLGMRANGYCEQAVGVQHRLSKEDLIGLMAGVGAMLAPPIDLAEVRASFKSFSAIGRAWRRDIGGRRFAHPIVNDLVAAIDDKCRSVLLLGLPGAGKTCALLDLQEYLEKRAETRADLLPIFVQSREFANLTSTEDRIAHGLPAQWVEKIARIAELAHVVVVIDSLDVLSIAGDHGVLQYFLAQIDRLLLLSKVSIVAACREFDRQYDRRLSLRTWGAEIKCKPLDWDSVVVPLLAGLNVDASSIDKATRELIQNPRELALYVELAQRGPSFNVVTSQALAQRYLQTVVRADDMLGDVAIQAIEEIAAEMLIQRSLTVPRERCNASQEVLRKLLSTNVLHESQDGQLMFGHQTLLDSLAISGAIRSGRTLNDFIQSLPPVPFVRPSIRSYVAHLVVGDRREFRKQLRTVLAGNSAFHIRRLVAECFAEQEPIDDDWALVFDLRKQNREVFQALYLHADSVYWHFFWLTHLIPLLKTSRDAEGIRAHVGKVSRWFSSDPTSVINFWLDALSLEWVDKQQLAFSIAHSASEVPRAEAAVLAPLLSTLLELPVEEDSFLGKAIANCVEAGGLDDAALWKYVIRNVGKDDKVSIRFDNKLQCAQHDFGRKSCEFFESRMRDSPVLLEHAVSDIEHWSRARRRLYGGAEDGYSCELLCCTSHEDKHSAHEVRHHGSDRILMDAIEKAVLHHARNDSKWWHANRDRLCRNSEGALRYFGIVACAAYPSTNLNLIGRLLVTKAFLESDLRYELGDLIQCAFHQLASEVQQAVEWAAAHIFQDRLEHGARATWVDRARGQLLAAIPCHLRSPASQAVLLQCEREQWPHTRQPEIHSRGGIVSAPFSYEVFVSTDDDGIIRLLSHYANHTRHAFDDFLVGGADEVGWQLREAASRRPSRFLEILRKYWPDIPQTFRDQILNGASNYLRYIQGELQPSTGWVVPESAPSCDLVAVAILSELEAHPAYWSLSRAAANAILACASAVPDSSSARRLVFLAVEFLQLREESSISGDVVDLLTTGINMARGNSVDGMMIVANRLHKKQIEWPETLAPQLRRFACDPHPAVRAVLLRRLPYLQSYADELGWELFQLALMEYAEGLWPIAEPCLYYAYHRRMDVVAPLLANIREIGSGKDLETWGRISALASLISRIDFDSFLVELAALNSANAWRGAGGVWTHGENLRQFPEKCFVGLVAGFERGDEIAGIVAKAMVHLFREEDATIQIPIELVARSFAVLERLAGDHRTDVFGMDTWLNAMSQRDPAYALAAAEIYLGFVRRTRPHVFDHDNNLTQLLTRLFAYAEELEEIDGGAVLRRVVSMQDALLSLGVNGLNEWLKAAERP